jgi:tRNA (cmo5U34)-methyltransferase
MTEFDKSQWAKAEFAQGYREEADVYIVERRRLLEILKSFCRCFINNKQGINVLDLGCGDGIITHELLKVNDSLSVTLVDGSEDMLHKARERLKGYKNTRFMKTSFQEMIDKNILKQNFDFIVSSLAIHHLTLDEKRALFGNIYSHLNSEGYFLNIDVTLAPTETLEHWYLSLWKEWIVKRKTVLGIEGTHYEEIVQRYKDNTDNRPDTLNEQLDALKSLGFKDVDCYYKYGIFTMYGGKK